MLLQTWLSYLIEFLHKAITHESLWSSYLSKLIVDILNTNQHLPPTHIIRCRELSDLTLCPDVQRSRVGSWWVLCHMATLTGSHWRCSLLHWPAGTDRHTATSQLISRELGHGQTQASWNVDILNNLNTENFVRSDVLCPSLFVTWRDTPRGAAGDWSRQAWQVCLCIINISPVLHHQYAAIPQSGPPVSSPHSHHRTVAGDLDIKKSSSVEIVSYVPPQDVDTLQ